VRRVNHGRRAQTARAHGTGPSVAVGQHGRGGRAWPADRRRAKRRHGVAGGIGQVHPSAMTSCPFATIFFVFFAIIE